MDFIKAYVVPAAVSSLFGHLFWDRHVMHGLEHAFFDFEASFELAASPTPHWLQWSFCRARAKLLSMLR